MWVDVFDDDHRREGVGDKKYTSRHPRDGREVDR